jgi:hypothetical protein
MAQECDRPLLPKGRRGYLYKEAPSLIKEGTYNSTLVILPLLLKIRRRRSGRYNEPRSG